MNITKSIVAWILTLTTALMATGCGNVAAENESYEKKESMTEESFDSSDKTEEEDSSQQEQSDIDSKPQQNAGSCGRIDIGNVIIDDQYMTEQSTRPDDETLAELAGLAVRQYEACRDRNKQGCLDTLSIDELMNTDSMDRILHYIWHYFNSTESEPEIGQAESVTVLSYLLMLSYLDEDASINRIDDTENSGEYAALLREISAGINADNSDALLEELLYGYITAPEYSSFPEEFYADPSAFTIDDPIVYIELDSCEVTDHGTFVEFDMEVISREYYYNFDEVFAWKIADESGVIVSDISCEPNEYGIYTIEDAKKMMKEEEAIDNARKNAKTLYNAAAEYISICIYEYKDKYIDYSDVLAAGNFSEANSDSGLDLSGPRPKSEGDAFVYDSAKENGITGGYIYIGMDNDINGTGGYFVQWKESKDSEIIGQYPCYFDYYEANVVWGSYYSSDLDGV